MAQGKIAWVASYPKSGNTWMRLMLGHLTGAANSEGEDDDFHPVQGISCSRSVFDHFTGLTSSELDDDEIDRVRAKVYRELARHSDELRFLKAHDAFQTTPCGQAMFPGDCSRGVIYLVRNPLDVAVSFSYHQGGRSFGEVVKMMNNPKQTLGGRGREQLLQRLSDWSEHVKSWILQKEMPVCVIRYEDLLSDTEGQLEKALQLLGLETTDLAMPVKEAVEAAKFEKLQEIERAKGFSEKPTKAQHFFRSGRSGEGRERLSPDLQRSLIERHSDVMRELAYL